MAINAFFILLLLLFFFLFCSTWIGMTLFLIGYIGLNFFSRIPPLAAIGNVLWNQSSSQSMMALPLFIFMGEILVRSRIAESLFNGLAPWVNKLPGGLLHVNILASTFFAAVSGSVSATTATVGNITIPEFKKRKYSDELSIGSLACSGTLGIMIPPSMPMLMYGIISGVSIGQLFVAGLFPGLIMAALFSGYIIIRCRYNPSLAPTTGEHFTWRDRMAGIPMLLPVVLLIALVLGSIYAGWTTPTEAAAVGSFGAILFAMYTRTMNWHVLKTALLGTVNTTCMIMLIVFGASYFSVVIGYLGIPRALARAIAAADIGPYTLLIIVSLFYVVLGCLVDGFSMIVMSVPIILPLMKAAGFDPLWFGIYLVVMVQIAQITPPVGFNLFLLNGLTGLEVFWIAKAALPFFLLMISFTILMTIFPSIVTYLPYLRSLS